MKRITKIKLWLRGELFIAQLKESNRKTNQELQASEDKLVDLRIEQIAKAACKEYIIKLEKFKASTNYPEMIKNYGPLWYVPCYHRPYFVYDSETAKYGQGKLSINGAIERRYNELRDEVIRKEKWH